MAIQEKNGVVGGAGVYHYARKERNGSVLQDLVAVVTDCNGSRHYCLSVKWEAIYNPLRIGVCSISNTFAIVGIAMEIGIELPRHSADLGKVRMATLSGSDCCAAC